MGEINYLRDSATGVTYDLMPKDGGITEAKLSDELQEKLQELELGIGSPLVASTAAEMTDTDKIYVYTGSETGYTSGNWYYYNGSAWTSGGVYNSMALETDKTLQVSGAAADAKVVGDQVAQLKEDLSDISGAIIDGYDLTRESSISVLGEFEFGTLDSSGAPVSNPNKVRSKSYCVVDDFLYCSVPSNIGVYVYEYDESKTYIRSNAQQHTNKTLVIKPVGRYIKIVCVPNPTSGSITIDDCKAVVISTLQRRLQNSNSISVPLEGGKFTNGYTSVSIADYNTYKRTAFFIKTNGAKKIVLPFITSGICTMYFYDSAGTYMSYLDVYLGSKSYGDIPDNVAFVRFYLSSVTDLSNYTNIKVILIGGTTAPELVKNFRVERTDPYEFLTFKLTDDSCATARLMLPPNYTYDGNKVPLILYLDGSGNFTRWSGGFTTSKLPFLYYLRDEGFAILSVFGWSSKMVANYASCGNSHPYPLPTPMKCLKAGIDYVVDRYNIDASEIHVMSKSQGGQCALYFASNPIADFKSIGMFSPVLDYLSMPGEAMYADTRRAIADDAGFSGDTTYFVSDNFLAYSDEAKAFFSINIDKLVGMNEAWMSLVGGTSTERLNESIADSKTFWTEELWRDPTRDDIYTHTDRTKIGCVPVKIWGASDDDQTPYLKMVEVVEQLKNGGCEAVLETLPRGTGQHSCADGGSNRVASITTALGIVHENIPVGWVENIAWIRLHMSK